MAKNIFNSKKIRLHFIWGLIFSFLLANCTENKREEKTVTIQLKNNRAESIRIPKALLHPETSKDSMSKLLQVHLQNSTTPVLGEYIYTPGTVIFKPIIPFTGGLTYEVNFSDKLIGRFTIPPGDTTNKTEIISVYPTNDTLPNNVLKFYIAFSKTMQEGQSLENIILIKNHADTIPAVFLNLDQELWNKERTMLTLWIDPGRIKRDLQPNIKEGAPLQPGNNYQLIIQQNWRDAQGNSLKSGYRKNFTVAIRDSISPNPLLWTLDKLIPRTRQPLKIELHESLDYLLLKKAIRIADDKGNSVHGIFETADEESVLYFIPDQPWQPGNYNLEIESRLEDLAGNNLNRLFDNDLSKQGTAKAQKEIYKRSFLVQ